MPSREVHGCALRKKKRRKRREEVHIAVLIPALHINSCGLHVAPETSLMLKRSWLWPTKLGVNLIWTRRFPTIEGPHQVSGPTVIGSEPRDFDPLPPNEVPSQKRVQKESKKPSEPKRKPFCLIPSAKVGPKPTKENGIEGSVPLN